MSPIPTMLISHEREKLIDSIIFFATKTKYCGLVKLFKLLYFFDFIHFRETGRSVTGQNYFAWDMGPVPTDLFFEIKEKQAPDLLKAIKVIEPDVVENRHITKIVPARKFDGKYFTKREKRILQELAEIFQEAKADQMIEVTHLKGQPWDVTKKTNGMKSKIDYMLALDGSSASQLSVDEIRARLQEMDEAKRDLR